MKEIFKEKALYILVMAIYLWVILKKTKNKEEEFIYGKMEIIMKGNFLILKDKGKDVLCKMMAVNIWVVLKMVFRKDMEF